MKILTLLTLMAAAYFVARGDQHAGCASVIAADGRIWNNVRMDWTIAADYCEDENPSKNPRYQESVV
jgi:hypothetical protein